MQAAVLVLLLGVSLSGVRGNDGQPQSTPDLQSIVATLQNQFQALQSKFQALETSVAQQQNSPRVGFFASFHLATDDGNHGPFNVDTTIKYKQVLTNVGNGYNAATGAFTAPVKGLYVFHFTMFATYSPPPKATAVLKKNGVKLTLAFDKAASDTHDSSTRVAVVTLEAGDSVYVELPAESCFYDYRGDHNSFSGFLLSPM